MKRWAIILTLLSITIINTLWRTTSELPPQELKRKADPPSPVEQQLAPVVQISPSHERSPASQTQTGPVFEQPQMNPHIDRQPQSVNQIKIGNSFSVLENVFALPQEKYQSTFGIKIGQFKNLTFFKPSNVDYIPSGATPVAMNSSTLKLYPVSQIIHLQGIDATMRTQLLSEGAKEYYYQSRLKVMSIQAEENSILQTYRDFLNRGLNARLEVLKDPPSVK